MFFFSLINGHHKVGRQDKQNPLNGNFQIELKAAKFSLELSNAKLTTVAEKGAQYTYSKLVLAGVVVSGWFCQRSLQIGVCATPIGIAADS